ERVADLEAMADSVHLTLIRQGASAWSEWRRANPGIEPDLRDLGREGLELADVDLIDADLRGADLSRANFGSCNLAGADLRETVLRDADLSGVAGLQSAQLAGADLSGAKLPNTLADLFKGLDTAKGISGNAQKLFVGVLAACLYSWLTIATTTDLNLVTNR